MNRRSPFRPSSGPVRATRVLAWIAALTCAFGVAPVAAQPEGGADKKVLLVTDRANDPFIERIRAEVAALGLNVVIRPPAGPLDSDAREQRAVAAIRVLASRHGVEVWMADATTGRTLARQLVVDERPQGPDQSLVALQTAEILRTGLLAPPPPSPPPPPPPPPPPSPESPPVIVNPPVPGSRTGIQAGLGPLYSSGGAGTAMHAWLSLENRWRRGFGIALDLSLPLSSTSISGIEGSADLGAYLSGLEVFAVFPPAESSWYVTTGLGGGAVLLRMIGSPRSPLNGGTSQAIVAHGYARATIGWKPTTWASIAVSGLTGTTFEKVSIRYAGNEAGSWGGIVLAAYAHLGIDWD